MPPKVSNSPKKIDIFYVTIFYTHTHTHTHIYMYVCKHFKLVSCLLSARAWSWPLTII